MEAAKKQLEQTVRDEETPGSVLAQARLDGMDYRPVLERAIQMDAKALAALFAYTNSGKQMGEGAETHSAILLRLMHLWGDTKFSELLASQAPEGRDKVVASIDYAWAGPEWKSYPKTLATSPGSIGNGAPVTTPVDGVTYHLLRAPASAVRILWKDAQGRQLRTFPEAGRFLRERSETPTTIMNGGIYEPGGVPSGLLIQQGRELQPVNRRNAKGNFFLKPNGIFLIGPKGAAVIDTAEYPVAGLKVDQAVQSGPLLLRAGKIHPQFNANSTSRLHRNGVGVTTKGEVVFVMTDFNSPKFPNLHEFATLFKTLGCPDALFLDGDISQMRSGDNIKKPSGDFGSFIAVVKGGD